MSKIDDIDFEMQLQYRREEDRIIAERLQEKKWKRKQLKYWWVANVLAIIAITISVIQFFYTTSKESEHERQIKSINSQIQKIERKYELHEKAVEQKFTQRRDSLLKLRASIEEKIK